MTTPRISAPRWLLSLAAWSVLLVAGLAGASQASAQETGPQIRLRYATFDPLRSTPVVPPELRLPPMQNDETGRFLLQFQGPVRRAWVQAVQATGVVFEEYVPEYAFVVRTTLRQAASLPGRFSFVRWTGAFHPAYKIDPLLAQQQGAGQLIARTETAAEGQALAQRLKRYGAGVTEVVGRAVQVSGSPQMVAQLARAPEVKWVTAARVNQLRNGRSAAILGAKRAGGVRARGLFGEGQIVAICDSGLDTGDLNTLNRDFAGRVIQGISFGRAQTQDWSDPPTWGTVGHGTHVAGSVLGSGVNSGSDPASRNYDASHAGVAPEARLIFQSLADEQGNLHVPDDYYTGLFAEPYQRGARVHTNSWGFTGYGYYYPETQDIDAFVYDHPDMVICWSAGNEGIDVDANGVADGIINDDGWIDAQPAAKNVLCIGASEGNRPPAENWGGISSWTWYELNPLYYPGPPFNSDYVSDNINGMAAFSSHGPCIDGRIKPDLVAPGTSIVSVWARFVGEAGIAPEGSFAGDYNVAKPSSLYQYMSGTSMATPLAAGAATLVREYYEKGKPSWNASAALVKATLINGAHDMYPGQYDPATYPEMSQRPNNAEGYGRIDLMRSLYPPKPRQMHWIDRPAGLETGLYHWLRYVVKSASEPLAVTVVWTDPPAATFSGKALVNDLDLKVIAPNGTVYYPNRLLGADNTNNIENVDVVNPMVGTWEFRIEGTNVPVGPQDYALVVSAAGEPLGGRFPDIVPPQVAITAPAPGSQVSGVVRVEVTATDNQALDRVALWMDNRIYLGARFRAPYVFHINMAGAQRGAHVLKAIATDFGKNSSQHQVSITIR